MSETPTLTTNDFTSKPGYGAEYVKPDHAEQRAFFKYAEKQLTFERPAETWDLEEPVEAFDPGSSLYEAADVTATPEYATPSMTRAEEIERSFFGLTDKQLLAYAGANTKAVWALKDLN